MLLCAPGTRTQNATMNRLLYVTINIIYQVIICWVLFILNIYNDLLFPGNFIHSPIRPGVKLLVMIVEGVVLILLILAINRAMLGGTKDKFGQTAIANKTVIISLIFMLCFAIVVIFK